MRVQLPKVVMKNKKVFQIIFVFLVGVLYLLIPRVENVDKHLTGAKCDEFGKIVETDIIVKGTFLYNTLEPIRFEGSLIIDGVEITQDPKYQVSILFSQYKVSSLCYTAVINGFPIVENLGLICTKDFNSVLIVLSNEKTSMEYIIAPTTINEADIIAQRLAKNTILENMFCDNC